jgi:hypothetical protein
VPKDDLIGIDDIPQEEHALGIYAGLLAGAVILAIGAGVLARDFYLIFSTEGLNLTAAFIFRVALLIISAYGSLACLFSLSRMITMQRMQVRKVDQEFKDFVMYARPLVEEIMRQRIIGERITQKLEQISAREEIEKARQAPTTTPGGEERISRWTEFLLFVAILANISMAIFVYLESHPWEMVPYSLIILAIAWWAVIARFFGLVFDERAYYIPAVFILLMPTLGILLRAYFEPYQVLYIVYIVLFFYIIGIYSYFKYLVSGELPMISLGGLTPEETRPGARIPNTLRAYLPTEGKPVPALFRSYLPPEGKGLPSSFESYLPPRKKDL